MNSIFVRTLVRGRVQLHTLILRAKNIIAFIIVINDSNSGPPDNSVPNANVYETPTGENNIAYSKQRV